MSAKNEQNIYTVTVTDTDGGQKQITGIRGILLSDLLHSDDIHLEMPCGGKGVCKKCLVKSSGIPILACQTYLNHDMSISLDRESVYLKELYSGDINISAKSAYYSKWGLAVDIGTTTIKITLVGQGGNYSVVYKNPHVYIGADVISRIEKALAGQAVMLTNSLRTIMREMILELCDNMKIYADDIDAMVVTGNTTMLYFLAGRNPESLAAAPFEADHLFGDTVSPELLNLNISPMAKIYLVPCISAFIGADIVAAILNSGMHQAKKTSLMIDIGTNGEIVLVHDGTLYCASTAAGPVFEGYSLSYGTYAAKGAIDRVWLENGEIKFTTIDNAPAIGICGSGIIEALAVMLELGLVSENGYLSEDFELTAGIKITNEDINQIQLAKGAIRAGIETLIAYAGLDKSQIEAFFVAGYFGHNINMQHAAAIGLIPEDLLPVVYSLGNAAHAGCAMILQDQNLITQIGELMERTKVVKLSDSEVFKEKFLEYMLF